MELPETYLEPMGTFILIRPLAEAVMAGVDSAIVIPEAHRDRPQRAIILKLGPECPLVPPVPYGTRAPRSSVARVGDLLYYGKFAGMRVIPEANLETIRLQEGLLFRPQETFTLFTHDEGQDVFHWHLAGEKCAVCVEIEDAVAKASLEQMREGLREERETSA